MNKIIEFKNVTFGYRKGIDIIRDVNLSIESGNIVTFLGGESSGKTSLAKLMANFITPSLGEIIIDGYNSSVKENYWNIRRMVGFVSQDPNEQLIGPTVYEEISFGLNNLGWSDEDLKSKIDEVLNLSGLKEFKHANISILSGGQKQKLAIMSVLAMEPKVLILDEALTMLDLRDKKLVLDIIDKSSREHHMTVLNFSRNYEPYLAIDNIYVIDAGRIVVSGFPRGVLKNYDFLIEAGICLPKTFEFLYEVRSNIEEKVFTEFENEALNELKGF